MFKNTKLLLIPFIALQSTLSANAGIYRIDFNYGEDQGGSGGLTGFMTINTALDTNNDRSTDSVVLDPIPNWVTAISLTFDPTPGSPSSGDEVTKTKNTFDYMKWDLNTGVTFNLLNDFEPQFNSFGFQSTALDGTFSIGSNSKTQNYVAGSAGNEFPLESTATTPGGLPLLGLGALIFYYKKLKNKPYKL